MTTEDKIGLTIGFFLGIGIGYIILYIIGG
jgi:hypothetical protein